MIKHLNKISKTSLVGLLAFIVFAQLSAVAQEASETNAATSSETNAATSASIIEAESEAEGAEFVTINDFSWPLPCSA